MRLEDIFKIGINLGKDNDPRGKRVEEILKDKKDQKSDNSNREELNDLDLMNPYDDSNILFGNSEKEIKNIAVGIDLTSEELLLIDRLKEKGKQVDLAFGHHPSGKSILNLYKMIKIQEDILVQSGVNVSSAEKMLQESFDKYSRSLMATNYNRAVDTAKLLNIPFMNIHTPADNMVHMYLENLFKKEEPYKLKDIIDILMEEEEYKIASKNQNGPKIISGSENNRVGKIQVDVTGGVEASDKIYEKMEMSGVGTLVGMHMSEKHLKKAKKHNINVIMAGHMSSDSLGMNLIIDEVQKRDNKIKILEISGFTRVSRR
ncbi:MAG: NGG1p interacting factor NIF3 [Fusobacteriota bacterium]